MKTILYLQSAGERSSTQLKFAGARQRLANTDAHLQKVSADNLSRREITELLGFWDACGLIIDCRGRRPQVNVLPQKKIPVVYLDVARAFESSRHSSVSYDIRATCHLAARELMSLDCASYGYAGYGSGVTWSTERMRVFAKAIRLNGHTLTIFDRNPSSGKISDFYNRLERWIQQQPKPFGVFAADDSLALHVVAVIRKMKLRIPADVAVLGVDNESPALGSDMLSSIQLDFQEAGRQAAELLLAHLSDPGLRPSRRHFGPVQLLQRNSTRKLRINRRDISSVLAKIQTQGPRGLTAREVASWMPGSRRLAEIAFRTATGRSILEEITATRIGTAKELLADTTLAIKEIAPLCGYHTFNAFRNAFKSQTGLTPRDWRIRKSQNIAVPWRSKA